MRVTDFAKGSSWAIVPERFEELARKYADALNDEIVAQWKIQAAALAEMDPEPYRVTGDGAAVISISGPIVKDPFLAWFFDGVTFEQIRESIERAAEDKRVGGIVLDIDSPGGTVNGTEETAEAVFAVRGAKPVASFTSGMMASAAYWIGSAAERVIVGRTAEAGSIGVLMVHREFSELEKRIGIKTTYLKAGRYKAIGNPAEPLSEDARAIFQGQLDQLYSMFVGSVALYRDVEEDRVRADMADGRLFIGDRAVGAGLADQIGNIQTAVDWVLSAAGQTDRRIYSMSANKIEVKTYDDLKAAGGDLLKQAEDKAFTLGAESVDLAPARNEGADQERERVLGLAVAFMGDEAGAKFVQIVKSGVTVEQFAAVKAIAGPETKADPKKEEMLQAIVAAGAENPGVEAGDRGQKDYFALVAEVQKEKKCSRVEAMKEVTRKYPDARARMIQNANPNMSAAK